MTGKSPLAATEDQRRALIALSRSRDRGEADRARAILLTLSGWTSGQIAQAFGVREDTVRFWRSAFMTGGIEALRTSVAPGPAPVTAARARGLPGSGGKGGLPLAAAPPHAEGAARPQRRGPGGPGPQAAQGTGR